MTFNCSTQVNKKAAPQGDPHKFEIFGHSTLANTVSPADLEDRAAGIVASATHGVTIKIARAVTGQVRWILAVPVAFKGV